MIAHFYITPLWVGLASILFGAIFVIVALGAVGAYGEKGGLVDRSEKLLSRLSIALLFVTVSLAIAAGVMS